MELFCAILLLLLSTSSADPQDLVGKMFTFPQESNDHRVILKLNQTELGALSVCMRVFSDLTRSHGLFLLTTNSDDSPRNQFYIMNRPDYSQYVFGYKGHESYFKIRNDYVINKWQHVCGTWDGDKGLAQLWIDGKGFSRKSIGKDHMKAPMSVILGQSCDPHDWRQCRDRSRGTSFVGMLTDLHVYDYVLSPMVIRNYPNPLHSFPQGNILHWQSLDFEIHGEIFIEDIV